MKPKKLRLAQPRPWPQKPPSLAELNPKGIPPQSPGLRGTSYPGFDRRRPFNPERVAARWFPHVGSESAHATTLSGLVSPRQLFPRVARSSQPSAGGRNPFGIANAALILAIGILLCLVSGCGRRAEAHKVMQISVSQPSPLAIILAPHP